LSKDFIEKGKVTLDRDYNGDEAFEIYSKFQLLENRKHTKNRSIAR